MSCILEHVSQEQTKVAIRKNGPVVIKGILQIENIDGTLSEKEIVSICRCGISNKMPFCDGSHKTQIFDKD